MRFVYEPLLGDDTAVVGLAGVAGVVDAVRKGRPYAFTPEKQEEYLARVRGGDGRDLAARNVDVSPTTVRSHRRMDPSFEARIIEAERERVQVLVSAAFKNAVDGNATLTMFLLQNWAPDEFQDRRRPGVMQQINTGPVESVEWSLQDARAEVLGMIDELEAQRQKKTAKEQAIEATSREADG